MSGFLSAAGDFAWWIAGLVLLVLEIVVPGVYLLFLGFAALVVGTTAVLAGSPGWFDWQAQVVAFVAVSIVAVLFGRRWYGARSGRLAPTTLNSRAERLIGRPARVSEAIVHGRGKVAVEDGWWMAEGQDLPEGASVRIEGARGSVLLVVPSP